MIGKQAVFQRNGILGWRDDLVVSNTCCSPDGSPTLDSSQEPVAPVPRDLMPLASQTPVLICIYPSSGTFRVLQGLQMKIAIFKKEWNPGICCTVGEPLKKEY